MSESAKPPGSPELERLAASVLAGAGVDWDAAAAAAPPDTQGVVRQLRALAAITRFYDEWQHVDRAAPTLAAGTAWGPLRVDALIGSGAYGEVYRAWDARLGREVALKLLRAGEGHQHAPGTVTVAEAHRLARVRHPHVVTVHGAERIDGRVGFWMELVAGETLAQELDRRGPLPGDEVVAIGRALAGALQAVHAAGLVHGDVKAQNVMREPSGRIVLMDFGAGSAGWVEPDTGQPAGAALTPRYAAPEVRQGFPATAASDVYSLGVLLHLLATGRFPDGPRAWSTADHGHARPPGRLAELVGDALATDPARRPAVATLIDRLAPTRPRAAGPVLWGAALLTVAVAAAIAIAGRASAPGGPTATGLPSVQRLPVPRHLLVGQPARRAPLLTFTEPEGHVAVLDVDSMTPRRLVRAGDSEGAEFTSPSPDGSTIAYQWRRADDQYELRVAPATGGASRVIVAADPARYPRPLDWSDDGRLLLVLSRSPDGARELTLLPIGGGPARVVRRFPSAAPFAATLSPDGRFVAFDDLAPGATARDVWVTDVRRGESWPLAPHAASDAFPAWTPDGGAVFFVSDRAGSADGWLQPVREGRAVGEPVVAARHLGRTSPLGFGTDGRYYFLAQTSVIDAFTAPIDVRAGRVGTPVRVSSRFEGASAQPAWSPDGRHLAYIGLQGPIRGDRGGHVLVVRDATSGDERILGQSLAIFLPSLAWAPDGGAVVLHATDPTNLTALQQVDVTTGAVSPVAGRLSTRLGLRPAPDGRHMLFVDARGLVAIDGDSGNERVWVPLATSGVARILKFAVTRDGRSIAYSGPLPGADRTTLRVAGPSGTVNELARSGPGEQLVVQCWTPDGQYVLFTRRRPGARAEAEPHALWVARHDGHEVRSLDFRIAGLTQFNGVTMHPDGTAIAYTVGDVSWEASRLVDFLDARRRLLRF